MTIESKPNAYSIEGKFLVLATTLRDCQLITHESRVCLFVNFKGNFFITHTQSHTDQTDSDTRVWYSHFVAHTQTSTHSREKKRTHIEDENACEKET